MFFFLIDLCFKRIQKGISVFLFLSLVVVLNNFSSMKFLCYLVSSIAKSIS